MRAAYGPVEALRGVDLEVRAGELVCLLGANGAGKSSTLRAISGLVRPTAGRILFDEPSLGLAPTVVETTFAIIADIRRQGTTVLMVEQNAYLTLQMADRGYVMETGRIVLSGPARDLMADANVRRAYLGG